MKKKVFNSIFVSICCLSLVSITYLTLDYTASDFEFITSMDSESYEPFAFFEEKNVVVKLLLQAVKNVFGV